MRTLFSAIHGPGYRPGQFVTANGQTALVVGWRSKRRGAVGKSLVVKITAHGPRRGKQFAVDPTAVAPRRGKDGNGPLGRVR